MERGKIYSTANEKVKQLCLWQQDARQRRQAAVFVAEGWKLLEEAPEDWIEGIYMTAEAACRGEERLLAWGKAQRRGYTEVSPEVMSKISQTKSPQGVVALLRQPAWNWAEAPEDGLYVCLEDVQDPGNIGTILRTAEAAGADGALAVGRTGDVFMPKTVRSTMGSIFRLPVYVAADAAEAGHMLMSKRISSLAADLEGDREYTRGEYGGGRAIWIGNEGRGLSPQAKELAAQRLRIPMKGRVESLNASVAAALLLYAAAQGRERRAK